MIQGSESERFHRLIRFLQLEIETRKELFNTLGSKDLPDYNRRAQEGKPFIVVLVENFGELRNPEYSDEIADIERLIQIGRNYGIHFILTALQGSDIPYKIANLIQQRIAFNLADHTEYLTLVGRPDSLEFDALPPGRCFISGSNPPLQCQIGLAPDKDEWGNLASKMSSPREHDKKVRPVPIGILETKIFLSEHLDQTEHLSANDHFVIGVDGDTLLPFVFNWKKYGSHLLIGGPSQSGRTSLLHSFALSLASVKSPQDLWMVLMDGSNGSLHRLADLPHVIDWINEEDGLAKNIAHLQKELTYRREQRLRDAQSNFPEILFLIDDYDLTCEALALNDVILTKLGKLIRQDTDLGFHFLIAGLTDNLSGDPLIRQLRLGRSGISLVNTDTLELLGGRSTSAMRNQELPQGRGYLLSRSGYRLVQFGFPDDNAYSSLFKKWKKMPKVAWKQIATEEEIQQVRDESAPAQGRFTYDMPHSKSGGFIDMDEALKRYMKQQQMLKKGQ